MVCSIDLYQSIFPDSSRIINDFFGFPPGFWYFIIGAGAGLHSWTGVRSEVLWFYLGGAGSKFEPEVRIYFDFRLHVTLNFMYLSCSTFSLRSRRLEVVGERENERARGRHARGRVSPSRAPVFSCAHYFQAPATQAIQLCFLVLHWELIPSSSLNWISCPLYQANLKRAWNK